jgi:hypothetical protein
LGTEIATPDSIGAVQMWRLMVNGWFILSADLIAASMIAGICLSALAGNTVEWRLKSVARLAYPFVNPKKPLVSIACVTIAGPYLLVNEAIIAQQESDTGWTFTAIAVTFALLWCLASGILCLEFLWQLAHLS